MVLGGLSHAQVAFVYNKRFVGTESYCAERWLGHCVRRKSRGVFEDWFEVNTGWTSDHPDFPRFRYIRGTNLSSTGWLIPCTNNPRNGRCLSLGP